MLKQLSYFCLKFLVSFYSFYFSWICCNNQCCGTGTVVAVNFCLSGTGTVEKLITVPET
jgi:hypothetical protein